MRYVGRLLAMLVLAVCPLSAGENSWTHIPFVKPYGGPYVLVPGADPSIWYWRGLDSNLRSTDSGRTWHKLELPLNATSLAADPGDPATLFTATYMDLLRSRDGGQTWLPVLRDSQPNSTGFGLSALVSRFTPGLVYASSLDTLWRSGDGGIHFEEMGRMPGDDAELPLYFMKEALDGTLYVLRSDYCAYHHCGDAFQLFRSDDQGQSWQALFSGHSSPFYHELILHPTRPESLYLLRGTNDGQEPVLWRSNDRGASFFEVGPARGRRLVTDATHPEGLFAGGVGGATRSIDGGQSWQLLSSPLSIGEWYPDSRSVSAHGQIRLFSRPELGQPPAIFISSDFGLSWVKQEVTGLFPGTGTNLHAGVVPGTFYCDWQDHLLNPVQLGKSVDGGTTWQFRNLPAGARFLAPDPRQEGVLYAFDGAVLKSNDDGASFVKVSPELGGIGGLISFTVYRYGNNTALVFSTGENLAHSADGGLSWAFEPARPSSGVSPTKNWLTVVADAGVAYATNDHTELFRSRDGGVTWEQLSSGPFNLKAGGGLLAAVVPHTGSIEISRDDGTSWQSQPVPFPLWDFSHGLHIDARGTFYLVGEKQMVLRSRDAGLTWQALRQDLPDYWGQPELAVDVADPDRVLLSTAAGLYQGNFAASPPLALGGGRFEAQLRWRTGAGEGEGLAATMSGDSGYFRLFSADRTEVSVRMVDERSSSGFFRIVVASQTDVELDLEVQDRFTGERWTHHNPAGVRMSFEDPKAFPREGAQSTTGGVLAGPILGLNEPEPVILLADRFELSVHWLGAGEMRVAQGKRLLAETAAFAFFDNDAVDLLVNVIDARAFGGKFWVFGASLTDTEFILSIRDRLTGEVKKHHNPAGTLASFSDFSAF